MLKSQKELLILKNGHHTTFELRRVDCIYILFQNYIKKEKYCIIYNTNIHSDAVFIYFIYFTYWELQSLYIQNTEERGGGGEQWIVAFKKELLQTYALSVIEIFQ